MSNPSIELIKDSTDALFDAATANPRLGKVKFRKSAKDGSSLEGVFVPFELAVRGFPEMEDHEDPYLGLRRIKKEDIIRHIIELSLGLPYDRSRRGGSAAAMQSIVDRDRLFTRASDRFNPLDATLRNVSRPLGAAPNLTLEGETRVEHLARKMAQVASAAAERVPVP